MALPTKGRSWPLAAAPDRQLPAKSGRFGLPLAPLDTCMRRFDLSRPNPAVRRNPLAIDTLSANRVVSQRAKLNRYGQFDTGKGVKKLEIGISIF